MDVTSVFPPRAGSIGIERLAPDAVEHHLDQLARDPFGEEFLDTGFVANALIAALRVEPAPARRLADARVGRSPWRTSPVDHADTTVGAVRLVQGARPLRAPTAKLEQHHRELLAGIGEPAALPVDDAHLTGGASTERCRRTCRDETPARSTICSIGCYPACGIAGVHAVLRRPAWRGRRTVQRSHQWIGGEGSYRRDRPR